MSKEIEKPIEWKTPNWIEDIKNYGVIALVTLYDNNPETN